MLSDNLPIGAPILEKAIDRNPLIVYPTTSLRETITLMSQVKNFSCSLPVFADSVNPIYQNPVSSNCVLIMKDKELLGIFTERDLVRLIASNLELENLDISEVMTDKVITLTEDNFQDISAALFLFRRYRIRHLPIIDTEGNLVGIISHESLRSCLQPTNLLKLRKVSDIMTSEVIQAPPTEKIINLAKLMAENRVSSIVIVAKMLDERDLPIGIVTERDLLQFQTLEFDFSKVEAQDVMSTPLFLLNPEDSLWTAHQQMQERRVRRLVVSWNWGLGIGIVTQTLLLKVFEPIEMYGVIETLQHTVQQLEAEKQEYNLSQKVNLTKAANQFQHSQELQSQIYLTGKLEYSGAVSESSPEKSWNQLQTSYSELNQYIGQFENRVNMFVNDSSIPAARRQDILSLLIDDMKALKKLLEVKY